MAEREHRTCKKCLVSKPFSKFYARATCLDGIEPVCKDCRNSARKARYENTKEATLARNKQWALDNPDKVKDISRKTTLRRYSLTPEMYDKILADQGNACKGCGTVPPLGINLQVDHDHGCCPGNKSCGKCIRGLLCMKCNTILGKAGDNPAILRALAAYLEGGEF
jgi:hypothetical protein